MNRYTELTPAAYNPMTMQEILYAPTLMRQKHDESLDKYMNYDAEIAKAQATDRDFLEAMKEKQRLSSQIYDQVEMLNKEGFNNNTRSNILKFNKDYQESVSPLGKLGQFAESKLAREKAIEEYKKTGLALGLSPEEMEYWIQKAEEDYKQSPIFTESGKLTRYDLSKYPQAKYQDVEKWMTDIFKNTGVSDDTFRRAGASIEISNEPGKEGTFVLKYDKTNQTASNIDAIEKAKTYIENRINDTTSEQRKYLDYSRKNINDVLSNSKVFGDIFKSKKTIDSKETDIFNFTPFQKEGGDNDDESKLPYSYSDYSAIFEDPDYNKNLKAQDEILTDKSGKYSQEQKLQARTIKNELSKIKEAVESNPNYKKVIQQFDEKLNKAYTVTNSKLKGFENEAFKPFYSSNNLYEYVKQKDGSYQLRTFVLNDQRQWSKEEQQKIARGEKTSVSRITYKNIGKPLTKQEYETLKQGAVIKNQKNKFINEQRNAITKDWKTERSVVVLPYDKTSEKSILSLNALQSMGPDLGKPSSIVGVTASGESKNIKFNEAQQQLLMRKFQMAKPEDVKSMDIGKQGTTVGWKIVFDNPSKDEGVKSYEMFIPLNQVYDSNTGMYHASIMNVARYNPAIKREVFKLVQTKNVPSAAQNKSEIGQVSVPAGEYFKNHINDGSKLDFKRTSNNSVTPVIITKNGVQKEMKWSDFGDLNNPYVIQSFVESGLRDAIGNMILKNPAYKKYKTSSGIDFDQFLEDYKHSAIELDDTKDILELSLFNNALK